MHPYLDNSLSIEERSKDIVSRLDLEEKISQMVYGSPPIERLGIPAYNWWSEALHGVARAGVATVFPQAIAMAASFDDDMLYKIASVISDEARAKHHESVRQGDHDIYKGLTFWSPNINIFRDPRWGRGHETFGEDPYLTSRLGVAFVKGLQGDNKKYLKLAACAKHFAVHSGPEADRHSFDAVVNKKDMYETYLPAFKALVQEANVESVMGAYNRVNGEPACGSDTLLKKILREEWGFKGHVVSDCWAVCDFHLNHKVTNSPEESAAMAVKAGCDLNCGNTYPALIEAVKKGLITEEAIDNALARLFATRIKLGMFDPQDKVEYARIPFEKNDHPDHHKLSLESARRSMVLLKNNDILPLKKDKLKSIAVIGPNADDPVMLLGNYSGTPSYTTTPLRAIKDALGDTARVYYAQGCDISKDRVEPLATEDDRVAEAVSVAKASDVAIVCLGLNSQIEGEQGDVGNSDAGGDKINLSFPGMQNKLLEKIVATGTKTIVAVFAGSAMDLTYANDNADAVIQAWYPGPMGGEAFADLLLGKSDFSGRLPVTFVKKTEDLPDFRDYSMEGRTYRFIKTDPLYPFGYGLSYNNYEYSGLKIEKDVVEQGESVNVSIKVTNKGKFDGYGSVQVYLKDVDATVRVPNYSLAAFKSVYLKAGEKKEVSLVVDSNCMVVFDDDGSTRFEPGLFEIYVGGGAPDSVSCKLMGSSPLKAEFELK